MHLTFHSIELHMWTDLYSFFPFFYVFVHILYTKHTTDNLCIIIYFSTYESKKYNTFSVYRYIYINNVKLRKLYYYNAIHFTFNIQNSGANRRCNQNITLKKQNYPLKLFSNLYLNHHTKMQ